MRTCDEGVVYLLNSIVEFCPKSGILTSRLNGIAVTLHTPSSYCLLKLINERYQIVSQTDLIIAGWPENGDQVSHNTFYQIVFNLRQGLEKAGVKGIIVTVPRQGLKIRPDIVIEKVGTLTDMLPKKIDTPKSVLFATSHVSFFTKGRNITLVALAAILLVISVMLYKSAPDNNAFNGYGITQYRMCKVNFNVAINEEKVPSLLAKSRTDCSRPQHIILTQSENLSRLSVISCLGDAGDIKNCSLSLYVQ